MSARCKPNIHWSLLYNIHIYHDLWRSYNIRFLGYQRPAFAAILEDSALALVPFSRRGVLWPIAPGRLHRLSATNFQSFHAPWSTKFFIKFSQCAASFPNKVFFTSFLRINAFFVTMTIPALHRVNMTLTLLSDFRKPGLFVLTTDTKTYCASLPAEFEI